MEAMAHSTLTRNSGNAFTLPYNNLSHYIFENLKTQFPKCNVMVRDGQVVGILDWEYAAYLSVWYEYISASLAFTEADIDWKKVLGSFWYPNLDEKGKKLLRGYLRYSISDYEDSWYLPR
ncbi:hypothetical protein TSTA_019910 [Talaromyces stipitatus ATCC 10500]|uniref:Aminoglycoside phosphotransferase domain-containing protein n=1 Tax=Talaromyces stipitatus (strain ATCC 10500 / CBS 375.48 / QM 6759 / NRRL 1006) TaxID=441959 RepID=B8MEP9_TALSN|nr:uncharacterized protein TSTA_019910 [Talaromyces stipitatus ATCC 10500]EED16932.1 hypothetical protein TSTA_019910 [Talaromyces stipitatus ATCC 10500]